MNDFLCYQGPKFSVIICLLVSYIGLSLLTRISQHRAQTLNFLQFWYSIFCFIIADSFEEYFFKDWTAEELQKHSLRPQIFYIFCSSEALFWTFFLFHSMFSTKSGMVEVVWSISLRSWTWINSPRLPIKKMTYRANLQSGCLKEIKRKEPITTIKSA